MLEATLISAGNAAWSPASRQLAVAQRPLNKEFAVSFGCLTTWNGTIIQNVSYHLQLNLSTKPHQAPLEKASGKSCHACCTTMRFCTTLLLPGLSQLCLCLLRIRSLCVCIACAGTFTLALSCAMLKSELYIAAAFSCNPHALPHTQGDMLGDNCRH